MRYDMTDYSWKELMAVVFARNDHVLSSRYMNEAVVAGTSATGAKSTLMPRAWRADPVAAPWA